MKVRKRDGRLANFDEEKIVEAIWKAAQDVGGKDKSEAEKLGREVGRLLREKFSEKTITVEDIQDMVEKQLIFHKYIVLLSG